MGDRVSFRQVGKERAGKLYKGAIMDAYNRVTQASIPSKYELVLAKQDGIKDGFGQRGIRFSMSPSGENPGPGHYPSVFSPTASPSYSKKGYLSGFISTAKRFKAKDFLTMAPGPGTYAAIFNRRASNPAPGLIPPKSNYVKKPEPRPAPGQYNPELPPKTKTHTSAFKSKSKRPDNLSLSEAPAPWHYSPNYTIVRSSSQELTSIFKQPINVRRFQINLYDPHTHLTDDSIPGPGSYTINSSQEQISVNASFVHPGLDRFGNTLKTKKTTFLVPGPGAYDLIHKGQDKTPVSGASFMSESNRVPFPIRGAPGPAFYRPSSISKKKSFHLNADQKWM